MFGVATSVSAGPVQPTPSKSLGISVRRLASVVEGFKHNRTNPKNARARLVLVGRVDINGKALYVTAGFVRMPTGGCFTTMN